MAQGSIHPKDYDRRGRPTRYQVSIELGRQPQRRCTVAGCSGRAWVPDDSVTDACPRCGGPLGKTTARRRQLWLSGFTTRRAAVAALKKYAAAQATGKLLMPTDVTLERYVDDWFARGSGGRKASTLDSYRRNLDLHVLPTLGHVRLQDLNASMVGALLGRLASSGRRNGRGGGLSPKTVAYIALTLRSVLNDAVDDKLIGAVPLSRKDVPSGDATASPEMNVWSQAELSTFIESVTDPLYRTLFALAGATGMRRGEVAGLRRKDIDLDRGRVTVNAARVAVAYRVEAGSPKTKRSRRSIAVGPNVVALLREHLHDHPMLPEALVFPVHPASITQRFDRAVARSGLPRIRFHDLRHSHVAHLIEQDVHPAKVSARLGHATVAYTFDRYGHLFPEADDEAAAVTDIAPAVASG